MGGLLGLWRKQLLQSASASTIRSAAAGLVQINGQARARKKKQEVEPGNAYKHPSYFGEVTMRCVIIAVILCGLLSLSACASNWSVWSSIGDDVSLSYTRLNKETWTWRFRNDGSTAITFMTFTYTDANGEHSNVLPGSLQPGAVYGGWGAYAASSPPNIVIKEIKRN